jgi:hypothetical protein
MSAICDDLRWVGESRRAGAVHARGDLPPVTAGGVSADRWRSAAARRAAACARRARVVAWLFVSAGDAAEELATARSDLAVAIAHTEYLQRALVCSRQIGMAMGILMERHRLTQGRRSNVFAIRASGGTGARPNRRG